MALALTGSPQITAAALDAAVNAELGANWMPLVGVTTNSNAAAGQVGEYISSTVLAGAAVPITSGAAANVTSISLTAGDWDVNGSVITNPAGTTVQFYLIGAINTVSATLPTTPGGGGYMISGSQPTAGVGLGVMVGPMRLSLASTTTVYLVALSNFSTSTNAALGFIGARRVR